MLSGYSVLGVPEAARLVKPDRCSFMSIHECHSLSKEAVPYVYITWRGGRRSIDRLVLFGNANGGVTILTDLGADPDFIHRCR